MLELAKQIPAAPLPLGQANTAGHGYLPQGWHSKCQSWWLETLCHHLADQILPQDLWGAGNTGNTGSTQFCLRLNLDQAKNWFSPSHSEIALH